MRSYKEYKEIKKEINKFPLVQEEAMRKRRIYMNIQAMMKQAQALQKDMLKAKKEIDEKEFVGESSLVKITLLGTKEVKSVKIDSSSELDKEDIEMLEDMIMVAFNDATKKIDAETEKKMGKFANIPGLF